MTDLQDSKPEVVGVRPYARLLTMLGEQLIKNDQIALVELMKNSYDADALEVAVDFIGFNTDLSSRLNSKIALTDNGEGMTEDVVRNHWLNPATPGKRDRKRVNPKSPAGRVMQGEKGIGRFAIFKIGSRARVITRAEGSPVELVIDYDLTFLDAPQEANKREAKSDSAIRPEVQTETDIREPSGKTAESREDAVAPTFLDELKVFLTTRTPQVFDGSSQLGLASEHGTRIEIDFLRSGWTASGVERAFKEASRLRPLIAPTQVSQKVTETVESKFEVKFLRDGSELSLREDLDRQLRELFSDRAVLKVDGYFSQEDKSYVLDIDHATSLLALDDPSITGLKVFRDYFSKRSIDDVECGSFSFSFFIFDLSAQVPTEHRLDSAQKSIVKEHRIYLYRDGVRVLPYGDPEDDWLQLDVIRGTQGANRILGNDQTVGFIYITQEHNKQLQDKTNREGLLDSGHALGDFVALIQIVLAHLRVTAFQRYQKKNELQLANASYKKNAVSDDFDAVLQNPLLPPSMKSAMMGLQKTYVAEREFLETRASRTEDLAGVGLSVEAASHDIVAAANQSLRYARSINDQLVELKCASDALKGEAESLAESLSFVTSRLQDIQGLFVSTRQSKRLVTFSKYVDRVRSIYASLLAKRHIHVEVVILGGELRVRATDAALLQVLINLFDNAVYWLSAARSPNPQIRITVDAESQRVVFSDNGPGVPREDEPYIFEAFYSGKGEEGKGLGLYIARQVGLRSGFRVDLISDPSLKVLTGANFEISFASEADDE